MPSIKLTDQFGADVDVQLAPASALLAYAKQIPALVLQGADLKKAGGLTLDQPALTALTTGLSFSNPLELGEGAAELSIQAGVHGRFAILARRPGSDQLFASDAIGEDIEIPDGSCYVCAGLQASAGSTAGGATGQLRFGAAGGATLEIASYRHFSLGDHVTYVEALRQSLGGFIIPARVAHLQALPPRGVATVTVRGSLQLSVTADLLAMSNPLATLTLPGPAPALALKAGGSVQVGASYQIACEYQVRAHKLDNGRVRLGWYRTRSSEFAVKATASAGVTGGFGDTDLFSTVLGAVSADPKADRDELARAGLGNDQIEAIQGAVKAAVNRRLELAVSAELAALQSGTAAFLYEIDLPATTPASQQAIEQALRGDLSALQAGDLPGVACVQSLWTKVKERRLTLQVSLLGIFGFSSIASLVRSGSVLYEPATGTLVVTDQASAERVRSASVNFGADTQKLRHVLAESFLITAVYRGTQQAMGGPSLRASHSFFELRNDASRADLQRDLRAGVALGLLSGPDTELPAGVDSFGRTTVHAQADYDDALMTSLFLGVDGKPFPREVYEDAGRQALQMLVGEGDADAARRRPALDGPLWLEMKRQGEFNFKALFPGVSETVLGAIVEDYVTIEWWADAMAGAASRLGAMRQLVPRQPGVSADSAEFQSLREDLAKHLAKVAQQTREEFGQPRGLVAMNEVSGRRASVTFLVTGPVLTRVGAARRSVTG